MMGDSTIQYSNIDPENSSNSFLFLAETNLATPKKWQGLLLDGKGCLTFIAMIRVNSWGQHLAQLSPSAKSARSAVLDGVS